MFNFLSGLFVHSGVKFIADFFSVIFGMFGRTFVNFVLNAFAFVVNLITRYVWLICKWVLGILDAMQFGFTRILGIDTSTNTSLSLGDLVEGAKDVIMPGGSNYYDHLMKIFRAAFGVALVLMIIFTVVAMVVQEYNLAVNGSGKTDNSKGKYFKVLFANIITIFLIPLIFYTIIAGSSAILTSIYRAFGTSSDVTIAGNVLAAASYDANRYRAYANANKRIPITISVYSMENVFGATRSDQELLKDIENPEIQEKLKAIGGAFANDSFLPFKKSTIYENGIWSNYKNYSLTYNNTVYDDLGQYFENFICTREQYYVMADFIDYCQLYNIKYYIKAMSEPDICWKYVDGLVVDADIDENGNALGDITLNVRYRDAAEVNMEDVASASGGANGSYDLQITTKVEYTSPISDALITASKLLGIDENSSKFNTMERDETGQFTNLVSWSTEKVLLKTSTNFKLDTPSSWDYADQIIVYEYFRFEESAEQASNNTLRNFRLDNTDNHDFVNGVEVNALKLTYRNFNSNTGSYSDEKDIYCVKLNGTYYRVAQSDQNFDEYGHAYYMLDVLDKNVDMFEDATIEFEFIGQTSIELSEGFDINKPSDWKFTDQVLIYEYFKDLTLSNDLVRKYNLSDFESGADKVKFNVFNINGVEHVYINGTYYRSSGGLLSAPAGGLSYKFLQDTFTASQRHFGYKLTTANAGQYGISNLNGLTKSDPYGSFVEIDDTDAMYQKYSSMNFRLSEDFSIYNSDTWSFRDYAIVYLYVKYLMEDETITIDTLKHLGLQGNYGRLDNEYCMQVKYVDDDGNTQFILFDAEGISKTSELKITQTLDPGIFDEMNLGLTGVNLVTSYGKNLESDRLISSVVSTQKFELSEKFDAYDPETWTIGDYLMIYLTNSGIIDTDISLIKYSGYTSLVYDLDGDIYYRFGREGDEDAFFLSKTEVEAAGYDVEKWFNTDLMAYLLTEYYNAGTSELLYTESNFGGGAYINRDTYIYNITGEITNKRNLQYILAKDLFESGFVSNDISKLQYSYANPEINPDDITTWKYIDLVIFQKTGSVPTLSQPYTSFIYENGDGCWFLVEDNLNSANDVYVNISEDRGLCYGDGGWDGYIVPYTTQIRSDTQRKFETSTSYDNYCNQYLQTKSSIDMSNAISTKAYYYTSCSLLKGISSDAAVFAENTYMTDMDMALINAEVNKSESGYFLFDAYDIDGYLYVKIKDGVYLGMGSNEYERIYFNSNFIVPHPTAGKAFSATASEYISFGDEKNRFDALLYSLTGSTSSVKYKVYRYNFNTSYKFINVNNNIVELESSLISENLEDKMNHIESNKTDYINFLYENFYYSAVSTASPIVSSKYNGDNLSVSSTWNTAVKIILDYHGMTANQDNSEIIVSNTGDEYLYVLDNGHSLYINLRGIADASWTYVGDNYTIIVSSTDSEMTLWRAYNTEIIDDEVFEQKPTFLRNEAGLISYGTFTKKATDILNKVDVSNASTNLADPAKPEDYKLIDLLTMYLDPQKTYTSVYKYSVVNLLDPDKAMNYVMFESFGEQYIVPETIYYTRLNGTTDYTSFTSHKITSKIFTKYEFNSSDMGALDGTVIGGIVNQNGGCDGITKLTSNLLENENGNALEIYIINGSSKYAIYGLENQDIGVSDVEYKSIESGIVSDTSYDAYADLFIVSTKDFKDLSSWTVIDFAMSYLTGSSYGSFFGSNVYIYNEKHYVKKDNKFMLIPFDSNYENIFKVTSDDLGYIDTEGSTKLIDLLRRGISGYGLIEQRRDLAIATQLTDFETSTIAPNDLDRTEHVKFSENFDIRDFSTWTISDYILYYVVTNDFYEDGAQLIIPYTYIPNFMYTGTTIYNLTYFDMFLADLHKEVIGTNTTYPYLTDPSFKNRVYSFNIVRDSHFNYYVQLDSSYYVKLSEIVYTNYAKMEIRSTMLGETFTVGQPGAIKTKISELETHKKTSLVDMGGAFNIITVLESKNFQTLANAHGALGQYHYLLKQDEYTGSVEFDEVIEFSSEPGESGAYFKIKKFNEFYGSSFADYVKTNKESELEIQISKDAFGSNVVDMSITAQYTQLYPDLEFYDYYYFYENLENLESTTLIERNEVIQSSILQNGSSLDKARVNLMLSTEFDVDPHGNKSYKSGFTIEDTDTWTVIDYLIMREFARSDFNHNKFKDMIFDELYYPTYATVYLIGPDIYLYLNGNFYNLKGFVELAPESTAEEIIYMSNGTLLSSIASGVVEGKNDLLNNKPFINNYDFRVLKDVYEFSINPGYNFSSTYTRNKENVAYTIGSKTYFKDVNTDFANANYRIMVSRFATYSTETIIKKSSWVEKLMTDMQVLYPDLNWGTLIATDGWLDTLGDFTSAYTNGLYTGGNNSSNTTAAGLVLSEFFMSVATEVEDSYADYEYSSVFDEATIQSLMLSLMGEENYKALVLEAQVFMDFFNSSFAPIIDDFAKEFGETVGENSLRLCAYKSYLATVLLSSDIGEYLYTIATRIYAEYTIGEYLANAGNDYSNYYSYVNNLKDEDGNFIDAYNYGTFNDLVRYENDYCGDGTPTFTFNVKKAFDFYKDEDGKIEGMTYEYAKANEARFDVLISALIEKLHDDYSTIYSLDYEITERGEVINSYYEPVSRYANKEYVFCYMIHVYWSIFYDIDFGSPSYLGNYRDYIDGNLSRWKIISNLSTDGADMYFEDSEKEKLKMGLYKTLAFANSARLYLPAMALSGTDSDDGFLEKLKAFGQAFVTFLNDPYEGVSENTVFPLANAYDMAEGNNKVTKCLDFVRDNSFSIYFIMGFSEDASFEILDMFKEFIAQYLPADITNTVSCWNKILEFNNSLEVIISELQEIRDILPGESTVGGSNREILNNSNSHYSNVQVDKILNTFQDLKFNITQYITSQTKLDRMQKRSITFTLGQYGNNYVSAGFDFTVRNKDYTFKNTVDPSRIAEYVYGGEFLESVGVGAQYTAPDFTGIVRDSKVYDNVDKVLKTNLESWPALRGFATNLADKTAELYFLTNLRDLDVGMVNGIKVDSEINTSSPKVSEQIAEFIKYQFEQNLDDPDTPEEEHELLLDRVGRDFKSLSLYLFSNSIKEEDLDGISFEDYKRLVLQKVIENEQNEDESAEERANKYMTLFNLLGLQFEYSTGGTNAKNFGRIVRPGFITNGAVAASSSSSDIDGGASLVGDGVSPVASGSGKYNLSEFVATQSYSNSTIDIIKSMSGLENRPTFEVLTREYSGLRPTDYYDEAYGDSFVVCTYKNGLYYPFLVSGSKGCTSNNYLEFYGAKDPDKAIVDHKFVSEYCANDEISKSYVIVAKGVVTADGYPTGIRKYNNPIEIARKKLLNNKTEVYNAVTYYRTNVGGNFGAGKDLVSASRAVSRVTTKNYTKYVYGTNYTQGIGSATTYTGKTNLKTLVKTDYKSNFVQSKVEYLISDRDSFGAISVLDDFSYFYVFSGQSWIILLMAFITIIPVLINAIGGVISRLFDLVILFIISPFVVSTNSLYVNGKNETFGKWKKGVESVLWSALGYIIGFSTFTLLIPMIYNVNAFVDVGTLDAITQIGGLGKIISYPLLNSFVKCLWVITAVTVLERMPKLLLPILTAKHGDLNSPHPSIGGGGKKLTEKAKEFGASVKKAASMVGSVITGKALLGLVQEVKTEAVEMIPGYNIGKSVVDKFVGNHHDKKVDSESKQITALLRSYGFDEKEATAAGQAVKDVEKARKKEKEETKKRNEGYKNAFKQFM